MLRKVVMEVRHDPHFSLLDRKGIIAEQARQDAGYQDISFLDVGVIAQSHDENQIRQTTISVQKSSLHIEAVAVEKKVLLETAGFIERQLSESRIREKLISRIGVRYLDVVSQSIDDSKRIARRRFGDDLYAVLEGRQKDFTFSQAVDHDQHKMIYKVSTLPKAYVQSNFKITKDLSTDLIAFDIDYIVDSPQNLRFSRYIEESWNYSRKKFDQLEAIFTDAK